MNDPHGIVHVDGVFHAFFQAFPAATDWNSRIEWGHATSRDLVHWTQTTAAITPLDDEVGCWSGSVVIDDSGPVMLYTRPSTELWSRGQVVAARGSSDLMRWERMATNPVIDGPPPHYGVIDFRDPQVERTSSGWRAVIGGGLPGVGGCALHYVSSDLVNWECTGILAQRADDPDEDVRTGTVWECPQLIEVDGRWVLIVSAMEHDVYTSVKYAVGEYDGTTFTAVHWGYFAHGFPPYATTVFRDDMGQPCAMSWLRENGNKVAPDSEWSGALSLVHVLHVVNDCLVLSQHESLDSSGIRSFSVTAGDGVNVELADLPIAWRLSLNIVDEGVTRIDAGEWAVTVDGTAQLITLASQGQTHIAMRMQDAVGTLDLVVDADIVEMLWSNSEGIGVARVPACKSACICKQ